MASSITSSLAKDMVDQVREALSEALLSVTLETLNALKAVYASGKDAQAVLAVREHVLAALGTGEHDEGGSPDEATRGPAAVEDALGASFEDELVAELMAELEADAAELGADAAATT